MVKINEWHFIFRTLTEQRQSRRMIFRNVCADNFESVGTVATVDALKQAESIALCHVSVESRLRCVFLTLGAFCVEYIFVLVNVVQECLKHIENGTTD